MQIDPQALKQALEKRITNVDAYRDTEIVFGQILRRAAQIAVRCVDDQAAHMQDALKLAPSERRKLLSGDKRKRLLTALWSAGPVTQAQAARLADLSIGEVAHYLRTTAGIEQLADKRWRVKPNADAS